MITLSIADFSLQAAKRYLQSAVFIDDNIYNQATSSPDAIADVEMRQPKPVLQPEVAEAEHAEALGTPAPIESGAMEEARGSTATVIPVEPTKAPFRTKDLVGSFAEHGIVCALYEPERQFSTDENSTVFKLCQTADLVILDWDFHEDGVQGTRPKALIERVVQRGNLVSPHHVRLIAIYTNTQSLGSISNSMYQHLRAADVEVEPVNGCAFRLQAGASRIVVLGKAGGVSRVEAEDSFTVSETRLAERLLGEFAQMNEGILPSCALLGMAAVRDNSRRILDKFRPELDGQFLLHRSLIRSSEEAFDQLPELLGDEFRAVIEDADYQPDDPAAFIAASSSKVPVNPHSSPWKVGGVDCHTVLREFWGRENRLRKVLNGKKAAEDDGDQPKNPVEGLATMCAVGDAHAHQRFAALLAVRTQYQTKHRNLGFGVIILNRSSRSYGVCVMPLCDSLRLKGATTFLFWKLEASGRGNPVVVQCDDGQLLKMVFQPGKPSVCMWMAEFVADAAKGVVAASKDVSGKYMFRSGETEFEWVAQLKPSHAQRIANTIGQQLSRVGLTEAEWARVTFASD